MKPINYHLSVIFSFLLGLLLGTNVIYAQNGPNDLASPSAHLKFVTDLPAPAVIDAKSGGNYTMNMAQTTQWLGLYTNKGKTLNTTVWGYGQGRTVTYPGPTFEAMKDVPIDVRWNNNLPKSGHILPVDVSLHMAHPAGVPAPEFYAAGNVPAVVHLHGGHTESASDGLPEAWFTQKFRETGPFFVKRTYTYHNDQEGATLWYHDHALGITRLNVYAGLAGFYLLRDDNEMNLISNEVLPSGDYEREIVIQDRNFYPDGELFLPAVGGDPFFDGEIPAGGFGGIEPSIVAEFFGDYIIVNSIAWPKLDVEQTKYRFRMLNGSDSRVYKLNIRDGGNSKISFFQIGTDNGLLPSPVPLTDLILAPGERADLVVDFTGKSGSFTMVNEGPDEPFKGGNFNTDITRPTGQIMQFNVQTGSNPPTFHVDGGTILRDPIASLTQTGATRKLALFEGSDADGRLQPLLGVIDGNNEKGVGGVTNGSLAWFEPITENPGLNDVEIWEVYNATEDAHPIHLHLVSFQILDRTPFDATVNTQAQPQHDGQSGIGGYVVEGSITLTGPPETPAANEQGWKDTFVVPPGYMGRVIAKFDRPGRYVWHCHILSHEDHEMMRPYYVSAFSFLAEEKTEEQPFDFLDPKLVGHYPNPFSDGTNINFYLPSEENIVLKVFDVTGKQVKRLANGLYGASNHIVEWNGTNDGGQQLPDGLYIYQLQAGETLLSDQVIIQR